MSNNYRVDVPCGRSGKWIIDRFVVTEEDEKWERLRAAIGSFSSMGGRFVPAGEYTQLRCGNTLVMSDTPDEINDHLTPIRKAKGNCLVNGLGLGVVIQAMLRKSEVTSVTVLEKSWDVIILVADHYYQRFGGERLRIFHADCLTCELMPIVGRDRLDVVWHDIWNDLCADNLIEMKRLHRRFDKRCDWQGSWGHGLIEHML